MRKNYRNLVISCLGLFVTVFSFAFLVQKSGKLTLNTNAANLSEFKAGYIISDSQMTDYNSMSEGEIQHWLNVMNSCPRTAYSPGNPEYTWHYEYGHYICLSQEHFGDRDGEIGFQYSETAAHIIWQAAQDFRINPKVLLVLLQKETGLITDPVPNDWDYRRATGYGCPDTAACSEKYYGFKNQVRNAAELFRIVMDGNSSYYPIGYNNVRYNPKPECGSSTIYIENLATSALYRYTPYQPNAEALTAGYGAAGPCGSYGNRNFFAYYQDWFGGITDGVLKVPDSSYVIDGEYNIVSGLKNTAVAEVQWGSSEDGANIRLYTDNGSNAQRWKIESDGEGSYVIRNVSSGKVLDVLAAGIWNGTNVQLYTYNESCAQKWHFVNNGDATYLIYSLCSGRVLDVAGANSNNGANIQIYQPNHSWAQKWYLKPAKTLEDGEYTISAEEPTGGVVDIVGGASDAKDGTNVQVYAENSTEAQKWKITYGDDGYYTIANLQSGKVLDVAGASLASGANVQIYYSNSTCAQKWIIAGDDTSGYKIYSACSGLALDTYKNNLQIYNISDEKTQRWHFSKIKSVEEGDYIVRSTLDNNMVLDLTGASNENGANIQIYVDNGSIAQKWSFKENEDGTYTIVNSANGNAVDVVAAGVWDRTNVQSYVSNGSCAQRWKVERNSDDLSYTFLSACSGKALDIANGQAYLSNNVQIYSSNDTKAQKWKLTVE